MSSVLITGTSKGIGFEAALAFGRAGHKVFAPCATHRSLPDSHKRPRRKNYRSRSRPWMWTAIYR